MSVDDVARDRAAKKAGLRPGLPLIPTLEAPPCTCTLATPPLARIACGASVCTVWSKVNGVIRGAAVSTWGSEDLPEEDGDHRNVEKLEDECPEEDQGGGLTYLSVRSAVAWQRAHYTGGFYTGAVHGAVCD